MQVDLSTKTGQWHGLAKVIPPGPASLVEAKLRRGDVLAAKLGEAANILIHHDIYTPESMFTAG